MQNNDAVTREPRGRPRDPSRDDAIIDATIGVLVRDGYDRLSMEGVATAAGVGKATIYRRWSSKTELVIDAMATLKPAIDTIDTGSFGGDIEQVVIAACSSDSYQLQKVIISICSALPREPGLREALRSCFTEPRIENTIELLERARHRGELSTDVDIALAASLLPSLMLERAFLTGKPAGRVYAEQVVGSVLLPVLGQHDKLAQR